MLTWLIQVQNSVKAKKHEVTSLSPPWAFTLLLLKKMRSCRLARYRKKDRAGKFTFFKLLSTNLGLTCSFQDKAPVRSYFICLPLAAIQLLFQYNETGKERTKQELWNADRKRYRLEIFHGMITVFLNYRKTLWVIQQIVLILHDDWNSKKIWQKGEIKYFICWKMYMLSECIH